MMLTDFLVGRQDTFAILGTWSAAGDSQPTADSTSVTTALSFWDYSLLTTVRSTASWSSECCSEVRYWHHSDCSTLGHAERRQRRFQDNWPLLQRGRWPHSLHLRAQRRVMTQTTDRMQVWQWEL